MAKRKRETLVVVDEPRKVESQEPHSEPVKQEDQEDSDSVTEEPESASDEENKPDDSSPEEYGWDENLPGSEDEEWPEDSDEDDEWEDSDDEEDWGDDEPDDDEEWDDEEEDLEADESFPATIDATETTETETIDPTGFRSLAEDNCFKWIAFHGLNYSRVEPPNSRQIFYLTDATENHLGSGHSIQEACWNAGFRGNMSFEPQNDVDSP